MAEVERAWLIEKEDFDAGFVWLCATASGWTWSPDSLLALRLARKEDAIALRSLIADATFAVVTEHVWDPWTPQEQADGAGTEQAGEET